MYINFWYPIVIGEELKAGKPEKVKVLGVDVVAFRDSKGNANVISDTCCHRGGSLGGAWANLPTAPRIVEDSIVCPYHGWEFGGDGKCTNIPSLGYGAKVPDRAKVDAYPVQEKYGIVFAFLGDLPEEERPPLLDIEEYGTDEWRTNKVLAFEVPFNFERSVENGLDPAHNEFVHPTHGFTGINRDTYIVNEMAAEDHRQGWGFWFMHTFDSPPLPEDDHPTSEGTTPWGDTKPERSPVTAGGGTHGPNTLITHINITPETGFRQYFFEQPISETKTKIFFVNNRNFLMDPSMDEPIHARNLVIAQQDIDILIDVYPTVTPFVVKEEVIVPADVPIVAYRDWLAKFDAKGWRIDTKEFNENNGKGKAYAIPGPGRNKSKNYPLDTLPLVEASDDADPAVMRLRTG